jgi:hypothetical protein
MTDLPIELPDTFGSSSAVRNTGSGPGVGRLGFSAARPRETCRFSWHHSAIAVRPLRYRFFIVRTCTVNFPFRLRTHMCVRPRKSRVQGFFPCLLAFASAELPVQGGGSKGNGGLSEAVRKVRAFTSFSNLFVTTGKNALKRIFPAPRARKRL